MSIHDIPKLYYIYNTVLEYHGSTFDWDGKLLQDISDKEIVDRLPIFVYDKGMDQLLVVPKLLSETGEACASAVYESLVS